MNEIVEIISTVGFPIACCVVMFAQNDKLQKTLSEMTNTMVLLTERIKDIEEKLQNQKEEK